MVRLGSATDLRVGFFGDVHGWKNIAERTFKQFAKKGVTHLIGVGDYWGIGDQEDKITDGNLERPLRDLLALMTPITGVLKGNVYLMPGNWDAAPFEDIATILSDYGQIISLHWKSSGIVNIGGKKIFVSHCPPVGIPNATELTNELIDPLKTLPQDVEFAVFGHIHRRLHFKDKISGKLIINPGGLDSGKKIPSERLSCAIYSFDDGAIRFYDVETGEEIDRVVVPGAEPLCPRTLSDS